MRLLFSVAKEIMKTVRDRKENGARNRGPMAALSPQTSSGESDYVISRW